MLTSCNCQIRGRDARIPNPGWIPACGDRCTTDRPRHHAGAAAQVEQRKASIRAKVEHPFLYVKRHFGYAQVRYRGLAKNRTRLCLLLGFANLLLAERAAPA